MERAHSPETLRELARDALLEAGASEDNAELVAHSLVEANLRGHDSHGVRRLAPYAGYVRDGHLDPQATPDVTVRGAYAPPHSWARPSARRRLTAV